MNAIVKDKKSMSGKTNSSDKFNSERDSKRQKKRKVTFDRIGKRWRESADKVKEYEIIKGEEETSDGFRSSILSYQEYKETEKLKQKALKKYNGKVLEDVVKGRELKTKEGVCYHIEDRDRISLKVIPEARKKILSNLKLIYGIGEVTEEILKEEGYETIEDLSGHSRFSSEAKRFLEIVDKCDTYQIVNWIGHWFPKSHPLAFYPSSLHQKENFVIFDIETMGLFVRPIILFGIVQFSGNQVLINQYLLRDIKEEPAALMGFLSHINKDSVFISFNGSKFDIPYIKGRLAYYGMKRDLKRPHFDLLYFSRRAWRNRVPNFRLITLEEYLLGMTRKDDVPSALVPDFYEAYMKSKKIGPLILIIEHNKQDLVTLANIFSKLHEEWGQ